MDWVHHGHRSNNWNYWGEYFGSICLLDGEPTDIDGRNNLFSEAKVKKYIFISIFQGVDHFQNASFGISVTP